MAEYDYGALKAEIALPAYAGMTDAQISASISANTIPVTIDISIDDLEGYLLLEQLLPELEAYPASTTATDDATIAAVKAAKALSGLVSSTRLTIVQSSDPTQYAVFKSFVDALLAAPTPQLTQIQHDTVLGMAAGTTSRGAQIGWPGGASALDVAHARTV